MRDYKGYFIIPASPDLVYKALTTETTIMLWTGEEASFMEEPNTEFSMWSGSIVGKNILFEPDKRIVQEWYFGDHSESNPSIVEIRLHPHKKGTSMEVRHTNIPEDEYENMVEGWEDTYAAALIDFYLD